MLCTCKDGLVCASAILTLSAHAQEGCGTCVLCLSVHSSGDLVRDYRSVSALYLFLRFTLLGVYIRDTELAKSGLSFVTVSLVFTVCGILIVTFKPYKDSFNLTGKHFTLHIICLAHLSTQWVRHSHYDP